MRNRLDREYFNSIDFPSINRVYYDKAKVDEALDDIRERAFEMNALNKMLLEEIIDLRNKLTESQSKGTVRYTAIKPKQEDLIQAEEEKKAKEEKKAREEKEIQDAVEAAEATRMLCAQMIDDAKKEAETIVAEAKKKADKYIEDLKVAEAQNAQSTKTAETSVVKEEKQSSRDISEDFIMTMADAFATIKLKNPDDQEYINEQWQNFLVGLYSEKAPDDMNDRVKSIADAVNEIALD